VLLFVKIREALSSWIEERFLRSADFVGGLAEIAVTQSPFAITEMRVCGAMLAETSDTHGA
jgi:hypothetical protein